MKTDTYLRQDLSAFFLEWEMFQKTFVEKMKTHIYVQLPSPPHENGAAER
jgi:hypothetical protein